MDDLAVGTKFYYKGSLCKVFEVGHEYVYDRCSRCDIYITECSTMNCSSESREDGKNVYFKWIEDTEDTEGIKDAKDTEDTKDTEEAMNEVTASTECCKREKTLEEEINELEIEGSLKERILARIEGLEKRNDAFANVINRYCYNTQRLERTIVMLATMVADKSKSIEEDEGVHWSDIAMQDPDAR